MISLIVAYDKNRVIGNKGQIPWHFPDDMRHFKETTMGHAVIMGRKTWESLPPSFKPLPGRTNIILSRSAQYNDVYVASSFEDAISHYDGDMFIIGGAEVYRQALELDIVDTIIATEVKGEHEGDVFFPELDDWTAGIILSKCDDFRIVEYFKSGMPFEAAHASCDV